MSNIFRKCHSTRVEFSKQAVELAIVAHVYDQIQLRLAKLDREIARLKQERSNEIEQLNKYENILNHFGI